MTDQARLLRESLTTNITNVRSFSRVYQKVLPISCTTGEGFTADVAVVRPVTRVGHHVLFQSMILRKRFATFLANEALPSFVLQEYVLIEILLSYHSSLADLALVLRLEVGPLLMNVKGVAVGTGLPANVANDRALLVLEAHVKSHVTLDFELLSTELAGVLVLRGVLALEMFLQASSRLTFELAHVASVLLLFRKNTPIGFPSAGSTSRVFPTYVRIKRRFVGTLVITEITGVRQALHIVDVFLLLGFVLQRYVHLKRYQATADLEAYLALVSLSLLVNGVSMTFQHLKDGEANIALLATVNIVGLVIRDILIVRDRLLVGRGLFFFYFNRIKRLDLVRIYFLLVGSRRRFFGIDRVLFRNFVHFRIDLPTFD